MAAKKITKVKGTSDSSNESFVPTADNKSKATTFRAIAIVGWIIAIGFEVWGIIKLQAEEPNMTWLIVLIVAALILAVVGNLLWKKANRLDPASEKDKFKFFVQNQLGAIMSAVAFLPLVILILTNKNIDGKQKGILGGIAGAALLIAVGTGIDFNPPSVEQYTEQTKQVEALNGGVNNVFWTKSGKSYHLFSSCGYINGDRTKEIFEGTVADARELKNITDLCDRCERQAVKDTTSI